ncbi:MAG: hypothetical protein QG657_2818 [Acidobacteriota bacterium]|nr:hypothetical protein [Acidobacteriota bacterium]
MSKQNNLKDKIHFFKSRGFLLLIALIALILALAFLFGDSGILELIKVRKQIAELRETVKQLETEKERLTTEIEQLRNNPMTLEKKAREDLWLMKKNEKVVVIVRDKNKKEEEKKPEQKQPTNDTN